MNWSEEQFRQLDLLKGKRQRGKRPPPAKEFDLHVVLGDLLARWCDRHWRYTHIASGEHRTKATAGRLKRMGLKPGWPDWIFVGPRGVCFLELKRKGETLSEAQEDIAQHLKRCGFPYLCTDSFTDAVNFLRYFGIVRVQTKTENPSLGSAVECLAPEEPATS